MRKLTVEMEPDESFQDCMEEAFQKIESYEILEALKINYEDGICVDLIEVTTRQGVDIEDVGSIDKMEIINVIRSQDNKHTCLAKYFEVEENMDEFRETDLDLIQSSPTIIAQDKITVTMLGENENLNRFLDYIKKGENKILSINVYRASYQKHDLLNVLTEKQRDILKAAHQFGYYDYPKKINSEKLSKKVDVSKATLVQHLRKAEGRIMNEILTGKYHS